VLDAQARRRGSQKVGPRRTLSMSGVSATARFQVGRPSGQCRTVSGTRKTASGPTSGSRRMLEEKPEAPLFGLPGRMQMVPDPDAVHETASGAVGEQELPIAVGSAPDIASRTRTAAASAVDGAGCGNNHPVAGRV
jgi:hypothetical protein